MNKSHLLFSIQECKIKASLLLKSFYSEDKNMSLSVAKRFKRLPIFTKYSTDEILKLDIKRKHALNLIAHEKGFESWADLKCQLPFIKGGYLNHWFNIYEEAKNFQKQKGGFILPYQKQFILCDADYIKNLGFDINDSDWQSIDYDFARPSDKEAWQRLYKKWMNILESNNG